MKIVPDPKIQETLGYMAFPLFVPEMNAVACGLSKRELFAAMAMHGILSNSEWLPNGVSLSADSVKFADDLLAELKKEKK